MKFQQNFSMPFEQADGKEIFIIFTAYFEKEFLGFDYSGDFDITGDYQAVSIDFADTNNETEELIIICKDYANDNIIFPEPISSTNF